jgi:phage baseplate assembly protein W
MGDRYAYLGTAVTYPIELQQGALAISSGKEVIENAFINILTCPVGTRYFNPEYGSKLYQLEFEPNDQILMGMVKVYIIDALTLWEKRANILSVDCVQGDDVILCTITYRILASNEVDSFIYPYSSKLPT